MNWLDGKPATDPERHTVWARERGAYLHTLKGADSKRSPGKLWDSIWKAAERGEIPDNPRICLAVREMVAGQAAMDALMGGSYSRPQYDGERVPGTNVRENGNRYATA